jgi:hypothetical protein
VPGGVGCDQTAEDGAITGEISAGQTRYAVIRMRSLFAVRASTTGRPTGTIIAPPAPYSTRITTSSAKFWQSSHPNDESVKSAIANRKM